jgi:antitoxin HicB
VLSYPARVVRDGKGFAVSFPDVPEALTGAASRKQALALARDALAVAMDFYFDNRRQVPSPSPAKRREVAIDLPLDVAAKVLLLNRSLRWQASSPRSSGERPVLRLRRRR